MISFILFYFLSLGSAAPALHHLSPVPLAWHLLFSAVVLEELTERQMSQFNANLEFSAEPLTYGAVHRLTKVLKPLFLAAWRPGYLIQWRLMRLLQTMKG
jgi:hypothetical protein